ncbi:MAG: type II secretion system F family protein [candidate division NC10 bacterium]|nr:type II secretion system F family protein [candidate division NC10 bacterium]
MPTFKYTATDQKAQVIRGAMEANDERAVIGWLQSRGYYPLRVERPGVQEVKRPGLLSSLRGIRSDEVLSFTQQLATLLEAGLELDRSLGILVDLTRNPRLQKILRDVLRDVQGGVSFADSLARHPKVFSRLFVNMVKAGEAGSALEPILGRLVAFLEGIKEVKDFIISALIYPLLLTSVGGVAVIVLLTFVLPRFAKILESSGAALPLPTQILLTISGFISGYWWLLVGLVVVGLAAWQGYVQTEPGRRAWDAMKLRLPILGPLIQEVEVSRFARTLGTLLGSGVPILRALSIVKEVVGNRAIAEAILSLYEGVKKGEGMAAPMKASQTFPPLAVHMTVVGEETGRLEEMLLKVAEAYEQRVRTAVKRLIAIFEPLMILLLGGVVAFIVLAMLLAIFSISEVPF